MKHLLLLIVLIGNLFSTALFSQQPYDPIDTVETELGTLLIYPNRYWEYIEERDFDGVLCPDVHEFVSTDTNYLYKAPWRCDVTITCTTNEVSDLKDTLWLCTVDSTHSEFCVPFKGRITSRYGYRRGRNHNGIDIDLETGDTIYAAFDGKIRYAQYHEKGFGNLIIIRHFNGLETYYAHCSQLFVSPNQDIKAGDPIGLGGNTGRSTGSHLHFEIRFYDNPIDPELIFDFENHIIKDNLLVHSGIFRPGSSSKSSSSSTSYTVDTNSSVHKVRSGDTLSKIARMYGTTVSKLCSLNNMNETDIIHIGQSIRVR